MIDVLSVCTGILLQELLRAPERDIVVLELGLPDNRT
jgi:hypothetical protein